MLHSTLRANLAVVPVLPCCNHLLSRVVRKEEVAEMWVDSRACMLQSSVERCRSDWYVCLRISQLDLVDLREVLSWPGCVVNFDVKGGRELSAWKDND